MNKAGPALKMVGVVALGAVIAVLIIGISRHPMETKLPASDDRAAPKEAPPMTWNYSSTIDEMRGKKKFAAWINSSDQPYLQFPYEGGSPAILRLGKVEGEKITDRDPLIILENGQFDCGLQCTITIKFDNKPPKDFNAVSTKCGDKDCLDLTHSAFDEDIPLIPIMEQIRKSKITIAELPIYNYGEFQYHFNTYDLHWSNRTDTQ